MPPKVTISRLQVLEAAFELVRAQGLSALSARRVARALGCSTQPVYRAYRSMDELKAEVLEKAGILARSYLVGDTDEELPFLQVGLGSLRFARDEPHLYRDFVLSSEFIEDLRRGAAPPDFVLERMREDAVLGALGAEQIKRIHNVLWFFSQGLATLFLHDSDEDPMPLAEEYLKLAGQAVIAFEMNRREP